MQRPPYPGGLPPALSGALLLRLWLLWAPRSLAPPRVVATQHLPGLQAKPLHPPLPSSEGRPLPAALCLARCLWGRLFRLPWWWCLKLRQVGPYVGSPLLPGSRPCAGSSSGTPLPPLAALTGKLPFSGFPVCSLLLRPRGPPGLSPARRRPAPLGRGPGLSPDRLPPAFSPHPQVYMNAVWHGWAVPMFLFLAILRLSLNYLIARWVAASSCARAGRSPRAVLHAQRGPAEPALSRAGVCWVSAATRPHSQEGGWLEPKPRPPPAVGPASGSVQPRLPSCCFLAEESPHPRG